MAVIVASYIIHVPCASMTIKPGSSYKRMCVQEGKVHLTQCSAATSI